MGTLLWKKITEKISMPKNWKRGLLGIFQHPFYRKTPKKLKGTFWEKFFPEKSLAMPKKTERGIKKRTKKYLTHNYQRNNINKPRPAAVGAISKVQK